uniref:Protein krueppel n=2 Tax=Clastoptera arizonana TaxID=38151 RepID=A0A1B6CVD5_9HEMI
MSNSTYCRLCALKCDNFIKIYEDEGQKYNLATKIIQCLQIWLYPEDVLPKTVCLTCYDKLNDYFDFFEECARSQESLMAIFSKNEPKGKIDENKVPSKSKDSIFNYTEEDGDRDYIDDDEKSLPEIDSSSESSPIFKRKLRTLLKKIPIDNDLSFEEKTNIDKSNPKTRRTSARKGRKPKVNTQIIENDQDGEEEDYEDDDDDDYDDDNKKQTKSTKNTMDGFIWKCTDCDAQLTTLSALKMHHQDIHQQPPNYKCTQCTKVYTRYRSFARHVKLHDNPKKFSCDICGKCFSQKTVLQSHSTVHSEERPHICPQCGKAFKQFSSLYLHSKCHLPEQVKPKFPCTVCPKEFSTKHTLETHFKIHTGERNFVCDICGKSFVAKGSLDYHILTHNDAKPHSCPVCKKGFKTSRLLIKHSTLHTGIKPHQCDVCGKQFRERGALKEHNRIHTGAMPYSCEFCGKLFRFKGILTVHRRQHTGERPYSCTDCRREFTNWANYNKHMKRRHRNSEHNTALASRILQRQLQQTDSQEHIILQVTQQQQQLNLTPPNLIPPQMQPPPAPSQLQHTSPNYPDNSSDSNYKLPDESNNDVYRVPSYVPVNTLPMGTMGYYIPPIHTQMLQTRNQ